MATIAMPEIPASRKAIFDSLTPRPESLGPSSSVAGLLPPNNFTFTFSTIKGCIIEPGIAQPADFVK
jgi:hypothetical protein